MATTQQVRRRLGGSEVSNKERFRPAVAGVSTKINGEYYYLPGIFRVEGCGPFHGYVIYRICHNMFWAPEIEGFNARRKRAVEPRQALGLFLLLL